MTVGELIKELKHCDKDAVVKLSVGYYLNDIKQVIAGYEDDENDEIHLCD